jgi:rfaE bifunctional protein nucleotidyltransferase chain/domain
MLSSHDQNIIESARNTDKTIILATGVFDLLHQEHILFLRKAKAAGDFLVVGIESDVRVKQMKGPDRPVHSQQKRKQDIEELGFVDLVFILPEDFSKPEHHRQLIAEIRPAILAVSSHTAYLDKKQALLQEFGGEVKVVHEHNPEVSTTLLLKRQLQ